jgi:hypothetical protein
MLSIEIREVKGGYIVHLHEGSMSIETTVFTELPLLINYVQEMLSPVDTDAKTQ